MKASQNSLSSDKHTLQCQHCLAEGPPLLVYTSDPSHQSPLQKQQRFVCFHSPLPD
eukprot:Gb_15827 [translate_table: standard]